MCFKITGAFPRVYFDKNPATLTIQYRKKGEGSLELARIIAAIGQSHNASYHGTAGGSHFA